jgi:transcriptional regulator NrdR family protein
MKTPQRTKRECLECGRKFLATPGRSLCSDDCRAVRARKSNKARVRASREAARVRYNRVCEICGRKFTTLFPQGRVCGGRGSDCRREYVRRWNAAHR